jgi:hypothetical protein
LTPDGYIDGVWLRIVRAIQFGAATPDEVYDYMLPRARNRHLKDVDFAIGSMIHQGVLDLVDGKLQITDYGFSILPPVPGQAGKTHAKTDA